MQEFWTTVRNMGWNLTHRLGVIDVIDILIVAVIIYELLLLTRHTRGSALLKGLFILGVVVILSNLIGLTSLNWLILAVLQNGALVLVILFQPELRKALERMGRSRLFVKGNRRNDEETRDNVISEILQTAKDLSRRKVGALIVFERRTGLEDVIETGTRLNAEISAPLLENIFEPNTPLHDGAIVIRDDRVIAGACILPLAEASGVSRELGTRHRAAVGISENTDAAVLVISEETGIISMAMVGTLQRPFSMDELKAFLESYFAPAQSGFTAFFRNLIRRETEARAHE